MQKLTLFLAFFTVLSLCYYYYQLILSKGSFYSCLHNFYSYPTLLLSPFFLFHHYYYFLLQLCINSFLKYFLFLPYITFTLSLHYFYSSLVPVLLIIPLYDFILNLCSFYSSSVFFISFLIPLSSFFPSKF